MSSKITPNVNVANSSIFASVYKKNCICKPTKNVIFGAIYLIFV